MRKILFSFSLVSALFISTFSMAQKKPKVDKKLQNLVENAVAGFHGTVGVFVQNLKTGKMAALNADSIFPTASIVKIPILVGIYNQIDHHVLKYDSLYTYNSKQAYGGSGLLQYFKDSTKISQSVLIALMLSYSDNTASIWNQSLAGGGVQINNLLAQFGLKNTRVNSRTEGREADWKIYGWGQTTPREMASLLSKIYLKQILSPASCENMYRQLTHIFYDNYSLSEIPPYIQAASKQGMVDASRSEVMLVNAPHGDYVFYIATKDNKDQSWDNYANEAWKLQRQLSAMLWHYFEPKSNWKEPKGYEQFLDK